MSKIHVMDELLANKIAAGEVVERCSSVVKELVENSIDAGSTEIKVELLESGVKEIKVTDICEASMINRGLCTFLEKTCKSKGCKLIYIGDASQLAPVGEKYSPAFDEEFIKGINALLPLGKFTQIRQRNAYDHSLVDNMGIVVERIESDSPTFSLGVSIELAAGRYNHALSVTIPISACLTFEELRDLVQTDDFAKKVRQDFEKQVEISFSPKSL